MKVSSIVPLTLIMILGLSIFGCLKDGYFDSSLGCTDNCIVFKGKVVNPNNLTDSTVAKVEVYYDNGSYINIPSMEGETRTFGNGSFEIRVNASEYFNSYGFFEFIAYRDGYLLNNYIGRQVVPYQDTVDYSDPVYVQIDSRRSAKITFLINKVSPGEVKNLQYLYTYGKAKYSSTLNDLPLNGINKVYETAGEQYTHIQYSYKLDGIKTVKNDSIFIDAADIGVFTLLID